MPVCIFCAQDDPTLNRIAAENATCFARYDNYPAAPGHVEIVPRRHVVSYFDLTTAEAADIHALVMAVRTLLGDRYQPDGYTIGINEGRAAGRTVDHLHVHVIPRWDGDVADPRGGVRTVLPCSPDDWAAAAAAAGQGGDQ